MTGVWSGVDEAGFPVLVADPPPQAVAASAGASVNGASPARIRAALLRQLRDHWGNPASRVRITKALIAHDKTHSKPKRVRFETTDKATREGAYLFSAERQSKRTYPGTVESRAKAARAWLDGNADPAVEARKEAAAISLAGSRREAERKGLLRPK